MAGFRFDFPYFPGAQIRPDDAVEIGLPGRPTDVEVPVLADVISVRIARLLQRNFLDGLPGNLRIELAEITAIASAPHKAIGCQSFVTAGSCPLCDISCNGIQHSE